MEKTPKSLRLQIGIFGRTNVGKSSFLNLIAGQDVSITSSEPGTTTDVVEKAMELLPIGPVVFLDTAGLDDDSVLAEKRVGRALKIIDRAEICVVALEPNVWTEHEERIVELLSERGAPFLFVVNKIDIAKSGGDFLKKISQYSDKIVLCSSVDVENRDRYAAQFKKTLQKILPESYLKPKPLLRDLTAPGETVVFIVPIDIEAPKGRLILPQVQAIRDCLDGDAISLVVKENGYADALRKLKTPPSLVVCDSQVAELMVAQTPPDIKCTTFSILFSRFKGDLLEEAAGAAQINRLQNGDKVLIAEACSHHPLEEDIGRVKIPKWLREYTEAELQIDSRAGRDYPENLAEYSLVIHCGGCMLTRYEKLARIEKARRAGVGITNYGIAISVLRGVAERCLSPFPEALERYEAELKGK